MSSLFSPTPPELAVVSQIFSQADPQGTGVLTGDVAIRIFGGANLPRATLGTIWTISDEDDRGWLHKRGVAIAVRLIGWAQRGEKITKDLVKKPGPLAVIEGINTVYQQNTGMSFPRSIPPTTFPPLTAQDKARFHNMFMMNTFVNSLMSRENAFDIFVKSNLSYEQLMSIWNLADTQGRGALDSSDFTIGMYFIQGVMSNRISFIPTSLPAGLYHQASGGQEPFGPIPVESHSISSNSDSFSSAVGSFQQYTGQNHFLQSDITGLSSQHNFFMASTRSSSSTHSNNGYAPAWDVSLTEKACSDRIFDKIDSQKRGYIEGEVAVPFMLESKLPRRVLAQIWNLADINNDGYLTRDGFAIAMNLIQKTLAGQDVPSELPPSLIPPTARASALGISPFSPANAQREFEDGSDLSSFDDTTRTFKEHFTHFAVIQNTVIEEELTGAGSDLGFIYDENAEIKGTFLSDKEETRELRKRMIETSMQVEALKADVERLKKEVKPTTDYDNSDDADGYLQHLISNDSDIQPLPQPSIWDPTSSSYTYNTTQYFTFEQHTTQSFTPYM